jgi:hypothetical protein
LTFLLLVHTEEVTGSIRYRVPPCDSKLSQFPLGLNPPEFVRDGLGDAFSAVRVGSCQYPCNGGERATFPTFVGGGLRDVFRVGDEPGHAVRVGDRQGPRNVDERTSFREFVRDGLGDMFRVADEPGRAIRVGDCQGPRNVGERVDSAVSSGMKGPLKSGRSYHRRRSRRVTKARLAFAVA